MKLGFITDTHINAEGAPIWAGVDSLAHLNRVIDHLNGLDLDAVVFGGDLADAADLADDAHAHAMYQAAMPAFERIAAPLLPIPGNHDRHDLFLSYLDRYRSGDHGPDLSYVRELNGWRLILLDTVEPGQIEGSITDFSVEWLAELVQANPDQPTLVFAHQPPFSCHDDQTLDMRFDNAELLEEALAGCTGLKGIFSGHYHRLIDWQWRGVPYHVAPSTAAQFPHPAWGEERNLPKYNVPGFQIIDLGAEDMRVETVWLGTNPFAATTAA